jgi:hypothetical protein
MYGTKESEIENFEKQLKNMKWGMLCQ